MALLRIVDDVTVLSILASTISGVVMDGLGAGLSRRVVLFKSGSLTVEQETLSSPIDGSYSFTVAANGNDRFRVEFLSGASTENTVVLDNITPIL